ncbi:MAG TPA: YggS family pyridoxal phosphate-dependent enzyme [Candidatus Polarisedimenticolaceae bacterium]|nr:YggS family pyridoxal phosphate-dependent enzyme [Candidatus Polarisedimenticolaceae bacterium]
MSSTLPTARAEAGALRAALDGVRARIAGACARARRDPAGVRLVAVSKTVPAARILQAVACGQHAFGENRVQEALAKMPEVGAGASWQLVGHLQRNKVREVVGRFELIHAVDSVRLAAELERRAAERPWRQAVLVQVNLAGETSKSGIAPAELPPLLDALAGMPHLEVRGLMTIPPPVARAEQSRRWFAQLRELGGRWALPELSMGMSDDFEVAVEEGATLLRVGRAIFGERTG